MISSSLVPIVAAFAFGNNNHIPLRRRQRYYCGQQAPSSPFAFVSWPELHHQKVQPPNNKLCRPLLPSRHPTELLLASSSSSESDDSRSNNAVKPSSLQNNGEETNAKNATKITATKTVQVTRIASNKKNTNIGNITSTQQDSATRDDNLNNPTSHSFSSSSTSSSTQGFLPDKSFHLLTRIHCTLTLLRAHFPTLLEFPPLASSTAKEWIYDSNVTVVTSSGLRGGEEQLAEGVEEVLLLNRALATAATAARRAGSLFDLAIGGSSSSTSSRGGGGRQGVVECELLTDPNNPLKVMVLWRTRLPAPFGNQANSNNDNKEDESSSSSYYTEFTGKTTVHLSPNSGLVTKLQINEVKINGVVLIESVGTALAAVRRAARSASSIFDDAAAAGSSGRSRSSGNPLLDGLLNGIQDVVDAVDALPSSEEKDRSSSSEDASLYVVPENLWSDAVFPVEDGGIPFNTTIESTDTSNATANGDNESSEQHYAPVSIDQYSESGQLVPLVGSKAFVEYSISHNALQNFAKYGIHQLAGMSYDSGEGIIDDDAAVSVENIRSLFTTDAELVTFGSVTNNADKRNINYKTLVSGAGKLADLYRSLALIRETSGGDWGVQSIEADLVSRQLVVSWRTESPVHIEGIDVFIFEAPSLTSPRRLPLNNDGDKEELARLCSHYFDQNNDDNKIPLKISRIENAKLTVAGVDADSAWVKSFVSAALKSGVTENAPLPDATIAELLRALTTKKKSSKKQSKKETSESPFPLLDDEAAVSFYGILRAIHNDLPNLADTGSSSPPIPAGDFIGERVELRGLLGEVLVRGAQGYRRLLGVAISSLRAALQTGAVRLAAKPRPTVEVTSGGSIKVNLILALWVSPQLPLGGAMGQSKDNGFGVPLKIEVSSEYVIDSKSGRISEHRILESRLNGVLTPGDVFSRWIKGLTREDTETSKAAPPAIDSIIAWVRSMQERK